MNEIRSLRLAVPRHATAAGWGREKGLASDGEVWFWGTYQRTGEAALPPTDAKEGQAMLRNLLVVQGRVRTALLVSAVLAVVGVSQVMANNGLVIDIKPGSDVNPINCKSKGVIPVAILTTDDFDALDVDVTTLRFGPLGDEVAIPAHDPACHVEDVDGDGDLDLVCHFPTQDTDFLTDDDLGCVTGATFDGTPVSACDVVTPKHCPS
jgi:hypothetical protein